MMMSNTMAQATKSAAWGAGLTVVCMILLSVPVFSLVQAGEGTEFPGVVLMVDQAAGKFAVKKDGGGTRFTFVANEKTKFSGSGLSSLSDLKKDDHVVVFYHVQGSQYLAASITKK
jgi:hypothetical protein